MTEVIPMEKPIPQQEGNNNMATLYKKILKVIAEAKRVPKSGYNNFHKYNYATESDLVESIRPILAEAKLAFFSNVLDQFREGEFTKVQMEFMLMDTETGCTIKSTYWGEGQDKGDKGLYKAYTGAEKYFLMKTFLIATGDDPEGDTTADERNTSQQPPTYQPVAASAKQVGLIKKLAFEVAKAAANGKTADDYIYKLVDVVGIFNEINELNQSQASKAISTLETWKKKYEKKA